MSDPHIEYDDEEDDGPDLRTCCQRATDSLREDRIVLKRTIREQHETIFAQMKELDRRHLVACDWRERVIEAGKLIDEYRERLAELIRERDELTRERDAAQTLARQLAARIDELRRPTEN